MNLHSFVHSLLPARVALPGAAALLLAFGCLAEAEDAPPYNPCAYGQAQTADGGCVPLGGAGGAASSDGAPGAAGSGAGPAGCTPGQSVACAGSNACNGFQVCTPDGTYGPCECGGGSGGAGGAGGAGAGGTGTGKNCGQFKVQAQCQGCFEQGCCTFGLTCASNPLCLQFGSCVSACGPTDLNCQIACTEQYYAGYQDYANIVSCMQQFCPQCVQ